jgi:hypothetical protein
MEQGRHLKYKDIAQPVNKGLNESRLHFVLEKHKVLLETNFPYVKRAAVVIRQGWVTG